MFAVNNLNLDYRNISLDLESKLLNRIYYIKSFVRSSVISDGIEFSFLDTHDNFIIHDTELPKLPNSTPGCGVNLDFIRYKSLQNPSIRFNNYVAEFCLNSENFLNEFRLNLKLFSAFKKNKRSGSGSAKGSLFLLGSIKGGYNTFGYGHAGFSPRSNLAVTFRLMVQSMIQHRKRLASSQFSKLYSFVLGDDLRECSHLAFPELLPSFDLSNQFSTCLPTSVPLFRVLPMFSFKMTFYTAPSIFRASNTDRRFPSFEFNVIFFAVKASLKKKNEKLRRRVENSPNGSKSQGKIPELKLN